MLTVAGPRPSRGRCAWWLSAASGVLVVAGWVLAFTWVGVALFALGALLLLGAVVFEVIARRAVGPALVIVLALTLLFVATPMVINAGFWVANGFGGQDTPTQMNPGHPPTAQP